VKNVEAVRIVSDGFTQRFMLGDSPPLGHRPSRSETRERHADEGGREAA
jgi:hypothetical protein